MDLRGEDENICKKWFNAIKSISKRNYSIKGLKHNKTFKNDIKKRKEFVEDIWKNEIIPNWSIYREFMVEGLKLGENNKEYLQGVTIKKNMQR